jgi:hypothetical protein
MTDERERKVPLLSTQGRDQASTDNGLPIRGTGITNPTRADPAVLMMPDRLSFCCWVEQLNDGDRWVFLSPTGTMHVGPAYQREGSLDEIREVLSRWRVSGGLARRQF